MPSPRSISTSRRDSFNNPSNSTSKINPNSHLRKLPSSSTISLLRNPRQMSNVNPWYHLEHRRRETRLLRWKIKALLRKRRPPPSLETLWLLSLNPPRLKCSRPFPLLYRLPLLLSPMAQYNWLPVTHQLQRRNVNVDVRARKKWQLGLLLLPKPRQMDNPFREHHSPDKHRSILI